jgi:hypothetical protein
MRGFTVVALLVLGFAALLFQSLRDQIEQDIQRSERLQQSPMWSPLRMRTPVRPGSIGGPVFFEAAASGGDDHSKYV